MAIDTIRQEILIKIIDYKELVHNVLQLIKPNNHTLLYSKVEIIKTHTKIVVQIVAVFTKPVYSYIEQNNIVKS